MVSERACTMHHYKLFLLLLLRRSGAVGDVPAVAGAASVIQAAREKRWIDRRRNQLREPFQRHVVQSFFLGFVSYGRSTDFEYYYFIVLVTLMVNSVGGFHFSWTMDDGQRELFLPALFDT